ncbi:hypothetical protein HMPREF1586_00211 [Gardnerella vaginalis JCP8522]|nr:hypothetical protein HMPREF1586_00211 [Gardnerella vaginalis JCP8522]
MASLLILADGDAPMDYKTKIRLLLQASGFTCFTTILQKTILQN